jgi:hypothetical protein
MREVKVDDKAYKVTAVPPSLTPYMRLLVKALRAEPTTLDEASHNEETIRKCLDKLVPTLCTPTPEPGHIPRVWQAICEETNRLSLNAKKFRGPKQSDNAKSRVDGADSRRKAIDASKPEGF